MRAAKRGRAILVAMSLCLSFTAAEAWASKATRDTGSRPAASKVVQKSAKSPHFATKLRKNGKARYSYAPRLQCVPFARANSGIALKGNAVNWWDAADGVYDRGSRPEIGSVLNFRATSSMRLGHVAVVRNVVSSREIEIDHANWGGYGGRGNVSRGVRVIDVSARNDWTSVRVSLGRGEDFGSIYPTYGFIYDRPDSGRMIANVAAPPPSDARRPGLLDEVAEAPIAARAGAPAPDLTTLDAPDRSWR